jgi:hypothetical protein
MSTKRIIMLGGGFGGMKCVETPFDAHLHNWQRTIMGPGLDLAAHTSDAADRIKGDTCWVSQKLRGIVAPMRPAWRLRRASLLGNRRVEIERR